ncbi:hypothetical protein TSUD_276270 [Trifolium subterraneum]|uniref:FAR1 domain-containing protein n=1 Tax=Trifolium subterraneum TaxID=3900 RepID=A0A2Z6NMQ3_TRISU|nr:hypothetical protein TSUD_276270 [Trifolium subterraneum]
MVDYEESADVDVDLNEVCSSNGHTSDDEDNTYSVSSGHESSDDGDVSGHDHDGDDDAGNAHEFADDPVIRETTVRINSMTSDEIRAKDFGSIEEAYDFYYQYGRCKGFSVRKSDEKKKKMPDGSKITVIIFGAALVSDETTYTYKWALNCFLECIGI